MSLVRSANKRSIARSTLKPSTNFFLGYKWRGREGEVERRNEDLGSVLVPTGGNKRQRDASVLFCCFSLGGTNKGHGGVEEEGRGAGGDWDVCIHGMQRRA